MNYSCIIHVLISKVPYVFFTNYAIFDIVGEIIFSKFKV
jgi:hypothetical protein